MSVRQVCALLAALASAPASAQTVQAPSATNAAVGHTITTAGSAAAVAPKAHDAPGTVLSRSVSGTRPFAQGVTAAGNNVSGGLTATGQNVQHSGTAVSPTAGVTPQRLQIETNAAKGAVAQGGKAAKQGADVQCDLGTTKPEDC